MMLEMPTASESSISILATRNGQRAEGELDPTDCCLAEKNQETILKDFPCNTTMYFHHFYWEFRGGRNKKSRLGNIKNTKYRE